MLIKRVEHVGIIVSDMEKSIQFYESVLGFKARVKGNNGQKELVFLTHHGMPGFEIELIRDIEGEQTYSQHGLVNHLAFVVEDIEKVVSSCRQKGVDLLADRIKNGINGRKTMRFKGPNGEVLQFVEERVN